MRKWVGFRKYYSIVFLRSWLYTLFRLALLFTLSGAILPSMNVFVGLTMEVTTYDHVDISGDALSSFRWRTSSFNQFSFIIRFSGDCPSWKRCHSFTVIIYFHICRYLLLTYLMPYYYATCAVGR